MGGMVNLTPFSLLTAVIFYLCLKVVKHYRRVFLLLFDQIGMQKIYIYGTLPITALEVNLIVGLYMEKQSYWH